MTRTKIVDHPGFVAAMVAIVFGIGLLAVLIAQPAPPSYAAGWSRPRALAEARPDLPARAAVDSRRRVHVVWESGAGHDAVAKYGQLDAPDTEGTQGRLVAPPQTLSQDGVRVEGVAIALAENDTPLCFWIEKGGDDALQRLMMARPTDDTPAVELSRSSGIMRDLALATDHSQATGDQARVYLAWSDNRLGLFDIYLAVLDGDGNVLATERRITDSGTAFVYEPTLAARDGVVHLTYFADRVTDQELLYAAYDEAGERRISPIVLESVAQVAADLGGGRAKSYPVLAVAGDEGRLHLYESLGTMIRHREIDAQGQTLASPAPVLAGGGPYTRMTVSQDGGTERRWAVWSAPAGPGSERMQVHLAAIGSAGQLTDVQRLSYASTSALSPAIAVGGVDRRHVFWQQSVSAYRYQIVTIDDARAAPLTIPERLGFAAEGGGWSMSLALVEGILLGLFTTFLHIWRLALAWGAAAIALLALRRSHRLRRYAGLVTGLTLFVILIAIARPVPKTLGQLPIEIVFAAHWAMVGAATAVVVPLCWAWRRLLHGVWIWAGVGGLWLWAYYALNVTVILRAGFAV